MIYTYFHYRNKFFYSLPTHVRGAIILFIFTIILTTGGILTVCLTASKQSSMFFFYSILYVDILQVKCFYCIV